jgi:hypothetical protein
VDAGQQFPPLPGEPVPWADQPGVLPRAGAGADRDRVDGRRAGLRQSADGQVAGGDLLASGRLGDDRPDVLQADRFAGHGTVAAGFVDVPLGLEEPGERRADDLDAGQPL